MNRFFAAALVSLGLATPALAGEGGHDPFPFAVGGDITTAAPQGFDVGQAHMPTLPQAYAFTFNGVPTLPQNGQNSEVATANSLPRNALVGTVQYAQARNVQRWFASRAAAGNVAAGRSDRPGS